MSDTTLSEAFDLRPVLYMDYDGVLDFYGSVSAYRKNPNVLGYLKKGHAYDGHYEYNLHWSEELVRKLKELPADWVWLTSWKDYTNQLDRVLNVKSSYTLDWDTGPKDADVDHSRKAPALHSDVLAHPTRPFVWVDDEATDFFDASLVPANLDYLVVKPDKNVGMTKMDLEMVSEFVFAHPSY